MKGKHPKKPTGYMKILKITNHLINKNQSYDEMPAQPVRLAIIRGTKTLFVVFLVRPSAKSQRNKCWQGYRRGIW